MKRGEYVRLGLASLFLLVGVLFAAYPDMSNIIVATDLFAPHMAIQVSYLIAAVSLITSVFLVFRDVPDRAVRALSKIGSKNVLFVLLAIFLINFGAKLALSAAVPPSFYFHDGAHYSMLGYNVYEGNGYTTNTLWAVMLDGSLPMEDTYRAPLVPHTLAAFYALFGASFAVEKLVFVLFSSLVPVAGFLLIRRVADKKLALLGAALLSFNWIVFVNSRVVHTELPFMLFSTLFLLSMFLFRDSWKSYAVPGLLLALAYLTRYQALMVLPIIALVYYYMDSKSTKAAVRRFVLLIIVFLIFASPWLVRNAYVAGNPFASDLSYIVTGGFTDNFDHYVYSLDTKPQTVFEYALENPGTVTAQYPANLWTLLKNTPLLVFANPLLVLFAVYGAWNFRSYTRREHAHPLFAYILLSYLALSLTLPVARFLYHLIPVFALFSVLGIHAAYKRLKGDWKFLRTVVFMSAVFVLAVNMLLISFAYSDLDAKGQSSLETYRLFEEYVEPEGIENATFMVDSFPYFYEYYSRGSLRVLQFPYYTNNQDFFGYVERHGVDYVVLHKDSILDPSVIVPKSLKTEKVFENDKRIVYRIT